MEEITLRIATARRRRGSGTVEEFAKRHPPGTEPRARPRGAGDGRVEGPARAWCTPLAPRTERQPGARAEVDDAGEPSLYVGNPDRGVTLALSRRGADLWSGGTSSRRSGPRMTVGSSSSPTPRAAKWRPFRMRDGADEGFGPGGGVRGAENTCPLSRGRSSCARREVVRFARRCDYW